MLQNAAKEMKLQNINEVPHRAAALQAELQAARREIESLNAKAAATKLDALLNGAVSVGNTALVAAKLDMSADMARGLCDTIKAEHPETVIVLAVVNDGKLQFVAAAGTQAVAAGAHAGKLVGAVAAVTGGKGGGRPDNAMAGGIDVSKIDAALSSAKDTLQGMLK